MALLLDRDGVLNEPVLDPRSGTPESPLDVADVVLTPTATAAVKRATAAGLPVVVCSNQPSAAKGRVGVDVIHAVHDRVLELLGAGGADVLASYLCLHHPDGTVDGLSGPCGCRKPAPGLLLRAAADHRLDLSRCWLIGDTDADVGAARAAGLAGVVIVTNPGSAHRRGAMARSADVVAGTTIEAVEAVLAWMDLSGTPRA